MCSTSLVGRAKELEIASILIRNDIYVFFPLVDSGADLLAANCDASAVVPVQVKYRATAKNLDLFKSDFSKFQNSNTVLAFVIEQRSWFIPFPDWLSKAVDNVREDGLVFVRIRDNADWLSTYEGDAGVRFAFRFLLAGRG